MIIVIIMLKDGNNIDDKNNYIDINNNNLK